MWFSPSGITRTKPLRPWSFLIGLSSSIVLESSPKYHRGNSSGLGAPHLAQFGRVGHTFAAHTQDMSTVQECRFVVDDGGVPRNLVQPRPSSHTFHDAGVPMSFVIITQVCIIIGTQPQDGDDYVFFFFLRRRQSTMGQPRASLAKGATNVLQSHPTLSPKQKVKNLFKKNLRLPLVSRLTRWLTSETLWGGYDQEGITAQLLLSLLKCVVSWYVNEVD